MTDTQPKDRLIVALDVPNAVAGLELANRLGDAVNFYKIGLGMLTGGGLALANELKQEHGKRIFLDMKLFDIGATVEAAVRGLAQFDLDFLTVHGDPHVVRAAREGAAGSGLKILGVTIASPQEAALIRAQPEAAGKLIVTPGVRPAGAALGDQKRVATPSDAIRNGADHIVVGRPIHQANDPAQVARDVQSEMAGLAPTT